MISSFGANYTEHRFPWRSVRLPIYVVKLFFHAPDSRMFRPTTHLRCCATEPFDSPRVEIQIALCNVRGTLMD